MNHANIIYGIPKSYHLLRWKSFMHLLISKRSVGCVKGMVVSLFNHELS